MDIEYARLSTVLKLPKGLVTAPKAPIIENAAASYVSPSAGVSDEQSAASSHREEDEDEGGLC